MTSNVLIAPLVALMRSVLNRDGFVVVDRLESQDMAVSVLGAFGVMLPQYDGSTTHEVTYRQGNEGLLYSQSSNAIGPHTEAPGWQPTPAYVALYCHRQARCGGGHTDLLDVRALLAALDEPELDLLAKAEVTFPWPMNPNGKGGTRSAMLYSEPDGRLSLRFSYNVLTTNLYAPPVDAVVDGDHLPLGEPGRALAQRVSTLFSEQRTSILVPEGSLLVWDNRRMLHGRSQYRDRDRHLTRFFVAPGS